MTITITKITIITLRQDNNNSTNNNLVKMIQMVEDINADGSHQLKHVFPKFMF